MELRQWLSEAGHTSYSIVKQDDWAGICTERQMYRYVNGKSIPSINTMKKIYELTGGQVDPNSFYRVAWRVSKEKID